MGTGHHVRRAPALPLRSRIRVAFAALLLAVLALLITIVSAALALELSSPVAAPSSAAEATPTAGDGCRGCHQRECDELAASAHADLGCLRCHGGHDGTSAVSARERCPDVCYECHAEFRDTQHFHPHDPSYDDPAAGRPLTCTSTCHDAHGTQHARMLRRPYEEGATGSDDLCLACHDAVGREY